VVVGLYPFDDRLPVEPGDGVDALATVDTPATDTVLESARGSVDEDGGLLSVRERFRVVRPAELERTDRRDVAKFDVHRHPAFL
jgi:hypothetical protein